MPRNKLFEGDMTEIGTIRHTPFVRLPDMSRLFAMRQQRFESLCSTSPVADYIHLLVRVTQAQHEVAGRFFSDSFDRIITKETGAIDRLQLLSFPIFWEILQQFCWTMRKYTLNDRIKLDRIKQDKIKLDKINQALESCLENQNMSVLWAKTLIQGNIVEGKIAESVFIMAVLQIIMGLATKSLNVNRLVPSQQRCCPGCGGSHSATVIVDWPDAEGSRFCSCLYCGTLWHYVRIKCSFCASTEGIEYQEIEESTGKSSGMVLAETCRKCGCYCKQLNYQKNSSMDVFADDIGSMALDLMIREENQYVRGAFNPFMIGY